MIADWSSPPLIPGLSWRTWGWWWSSSQKVSASWTWRSMPTGLSGETYVPYACVIRNWDMKTQVSKVTYQYNSSVHRSTSYTPNLLHTVHEMCSPGLLNPDGIPADTPLSLPANKVNLTKQMMEQKLWDRESCRGARKHYIDAHKSIIYSVPSTHPLTLECGSTSYVHHLLREIRCLTGS